MENFGGKGVTFRVGDDVAVLLCGRGESWGIVIADVKGDKCVFFLFRYIFRPFYGIFGTFPQVHFSRLCNFVVYSVEDVFADDANFGFAWINESAGRVI